MAMPGGPKDYFLRPGATVAEFVFFISSGSDVVDQRDLFEGMVRTAHNQFRIRRDPNRAFALDVDRWEQDAPIVTDNPNAEFVRRACNAHSTVVLLSKAVRPGTREEIEGVLNQNDVQLSVIWMKQPGRVRDKGLRKFLKENEDKFLYLVTGPPDSPESILAMFRIIAAALADITHGARRELFYESR